MLNALAGVKGLARVSKTPGRTQHLNYFSLGDGNFLVDLPGYGYAKVPPDVQQHWENLLGQYLQTREPLCGLVIIMDARHPLTALDEQMLDWFAPTGKPVVAVLVTGRPPRVMRAIAATFGHRGTAICSNGALAYDMRAGTVTAGEVVQAGGGRACAPARKGGQDRAQRP